MTTLKRRISRGAFLDILETRLREKSLKHRDFVALSKLYADVVGWKEKRKRKIKKEQEIANQPKEPTMEEVILQLEKEHKNG